MPQQEDSFYVLVCCGQCEIAAQNTETRVLLFIHSFVFLLFWTGGGKRVVVSVFPLASAERHEQAHSFVIRDDNNQ